MIEVALRPDGSVAAVTSIPAGGDRSIAGDPPADDATLFPLDGLPLGHGGDLARGSPARSAIEAWRGGFSFALWDREHATLHAFRDHYGARPLYYHAAPGRLLLASGIPDIIRALPAPPPIDETAILEYLAAGTLSEDRTFHSGILRVPPASQLIGATGGARIERYWRPWVGPWSGSGDSTDLAEEFRRLFQHAVAGALAGPGPVGVLLSGGPDSSAVLGMAAQVARREAPPGGPPRVALTMVFETVRQCDEGDPARRTADLHDVTWRPIRVEGHSPLYRLDEFLRSFGEPPCSVNLSLEALLLESARREGLAVLLDGHDADALFTPSAAYLSTLVRRRRFGRLAREVAALRRHHRLGLLGLARMTAVPLVPAPVRRLRRKAPRWLRRDAVVRSGLERLLRPPPSSECFEEAEAERALGPRVGLALEVSRCLERMHGVEGRHPFFDPALVRFLLSLPIETRFRDGESKELMRRALADLLTTTTRRRIDKTNYTPYFDWSLRAHLGSDLERLARTGSACLERYVDWDRARPMIRAFLAGHPGDRMAIWRLLVLERWLMLESAQQNCSETTSHARRADR